MMSIARATIKFLVTNVDRVVADKAQTHWPRLERLVP